MGRMAGKGPSEGSGGNEIWSTFVVFTMVWMAPRSYVARNIHQRLQWMSGT